MTVLLACTGHLGENNPAREDSVDFDRTGRSLEDFAEPFAVDLVVDLEGKKHDHNYDVTAVVDYVVDFLDCTTGGDGEGEDWVLADKAVGDHYSDDNRAHLARVCIV